MLYMVIETFLGGDPVPVYRRFREWMANWDDITGFEVIPVVTSAEAAAAVAPRL